MNTMSHNIAHVGITLFKRSSSIADKFVPIDLLCSCNVVNARIKYFVGSFIVCRNSEQKRYGKV